MKNHEKINPHPDSVRFRQGRNPLITMFACAMVLPMSLPLMAQSFPDNALVYKVTQHGIDDAQVSKLIDSFELKDRPERSDGALRYTDTKQFLALPMRKLADDVKTENEDDGEIVFEGFDVDAIKELKVLNPEEARTLVSQKLKSMDLLPEEAEALASNSQFELVSIKGDTIIDQAIDTVVSYQFKLKGIPLEGPGSKIRVAFAPSGDTSQLSYAFRSLEPLDEVRVVKRDEAFKRCATWTFDNKGSSHAVKNASLAYFAPPLSEKIETLEPSIRCESTDENGAASQVYFVSALIDAKPAPIEPSPQKNRENRKNRKFSDFFDFSLINTAHAAFNRRDVGSEGTGPCSGLPNTGANLQSFNSRMTSDGVAVQFSWLDANAWEQDWKDPSLSGDDQDWVDDVDMAYWQGHGWPSGFSFSGCSSNDDASMTNTDALWGNRNVEWISLFTCLVLKNDSGGQRWWQRWGPAFDRLHQINSFDTVSYHSSQHGGIFANYMLKNNPLNVRQAWSQASIDDQPAQVIWATMGVVSGGSLNNFNDYYWGKGSVGPDIPANQIDSYWRISGGS
ncbi:MAG: DUF6345 domain-containing protein [Arenicella sp.]